MVIEGYTCIGGYTWLLAVIHGYRGLYMVIAGYRGL